MSIYTIKQSKYITLGLIIILGLFLLFALENLFPAIMGSIVLYVLFKRWFIYLADKKKINSGISACIIIIITLLIIVLPFVLLSFMIIQKINYFVQHPTIISSFIAEIQKIVGIQLNDPTLIEKSIQQIGQFTIGLFSSIINFTLKLLLTISIMYFILYYMLKKHELFESKFYKYMPFREKNSQHFADALRKATLSNVVGHSFIAFVQGSFVALGFLIFSFPDPIFWGMISTLLSFLPVIGSPIIWLPAAVIAIARGDTFNGIALLIWGTVIVGQIDNVLRLYINKKFADTHPIVTIIGVIIGIPIFGILGLVYGPLMISFFILLVRLYEEAFADEFTPEEERIVNFTEPKND